MILCTGHPKPAQRQNLGIRNRVQLLQIQRCCQHPISNANRADNNWILLMSGVSIYPTLLVTTITIAASSAWTRRTNGT